MGLPVLKLPEGYRIGMRIKTNARYSACYMRSPENRYGTIVGGSKSNDGPILIKLDAHKYPKALTPNLFDIVEDSKANEGE